MLTLLAFVAAAGGGFPPRQNKTIVEKARDKTKSYANTFKAPVGRYRNDGPSVEALARLPAPSTSTGSISALIHPSIPDMRAKPVDPEERFVLGKRNTGTSRTERVYGKGVYIPPVVKSEKAKPPAIDFFAKKPAAAAAAGASRPAYPDDTPNHSTIALSPLASLHRSPPPPPSSLARSVPVSPPVSRARPSAKPLPPPTAPAPPTVTSSHSNDVFAILSAKQPPSPPRPSADQVDRPPPPTSTLPPGVKRKAPNSMFIPPKRAKAAVQ